MIVTSVQIKTAKTQKHLYCPVFTKTGIFIENARFFNFLEDIIFLKLALLPICYQCPKRLQSVDDAAETIHIYGGKIGGQFFHDPAKCTESGAAYLTDDKQESGDRAVSALIVLRYSVAAVGDKVHIYQ